jgi:iron complex outermembrane recepter protein
MSRGKAAGGNSLTAGGARDSSILPLWGRILIALALTTPAHAEPRRHFDVPAGPLADALIRFGEQGALSIGALDARLKGVRSPGVSGDLAPRAALKRLLAGTGYGFLIADGGAVRIVPAKRPPPPPPPAPNQQGDIIVTASKRDAPLASFPGSVDIVTLEDEEPTSAGARSTESGLARLPVIATTNLGPARNKIFIRGIADSSFTGPTQATAGQYFGDVRLTYNAPDPDLNLYDVRRIEVLQGPQGTLYGAGSLGGIMRIVPNAPNLARISGAIDGGFSATESGAPGGDVAAMLNMPIRHDSIGLRAVGYYSVDGGYIDDAERHLSNINRTRTSGGRATLRIAPGDEWTIDLAAVVQNIATRDSQYAERGLPPLTRASSIAQPYDNDYTLGSVTVRKSWDTLELVSATGIVEHDVDARYDATGYAGPGLAALDEDDTITLISQETRLSRRFAHGSWVVGGSFLSDVDRIRRRLGDPSLPPPTAGIRNSTTEFALFGEATRKLTPSLSATVGARVTFSHLAGSPLDNPTPGDFDRANTRVQLLPSAALAWRMGPRLTWYARYEEGYRAGGLALGDVTVSGLKRFLPDRIRTAEAGVRLGRPGVDRLTLSASLAFSDWENIQADLVDAAANPFTANIGDGRVLSAAASLHWSPVRAFSIEAGLFAADSALRHPAPGFGSSDQAELPNIPELGAYGALAWAHPLAPRLDLKLRASVRYVGSSQLGVGPLLDLKQGNYVDSAIGARLERGRHALLIDINNLLNVRGNRFALGNPYGVGDGRQITPLRPRSIRIGIHEAF